MNRNILKNIIFTNCNCILNQKIINYLNNFLTEYETAKTTINKHNEENYINFNDIKSQFIKRDFPIKNHNLKNNISDNDFIIISFDDNRIKFN